MSWRTVRFKSVWEMWRTAWRCIRSPSKLPKRIVKNQLLLITPLYLVLLVLAQPYLLFSLSEYCVWWVYVIYACMFVCGLATIALGVWPLLIVLNIASMLTFYTRPRIESFFQALVVWAGYNFGWVSLMYFFLVREWFRRRRGVRGSIDPYCERLYRLGWARPGPDPPSWSTREEWEALKKYMLTGVIIVMGALLYVIMIPILIIELLH